MTQTIRQGRSSVKDFGAAARWKDAKAGSILSAHVVDWQQSSVTAP